MKQLVSKVLAITKTQTIKDTGVVVVGMGLSTVLSAASIFLIARVLGPAGFGLYSTALAIVVIVIDSIGLAINSAIIKFASQKTPQANSFIKFGFLLKVILGLILTIAFAVISQPLAALINNDLKTPLLLVSLFIPATFLVRFFKSVLQAEKKFLKDSIIEVATSLLRLLSLIGFYWLFKRTVVISLTAYLIGIIGAFIIGSWLISWDFLKAKVTQETKRTFFSFQKWLTFGFIIAATHARIDSVILLKLAGPAMVGFYQAGLRFFMPVMQLGAVLSLVFAPRFASFPSFQQSKKYLFKAAKLAGGLALAVLLIIPTAAWLVKLFFGNQYQAAVLPTQILALGFAFFIVGAPFVSHLIYATSRTKQFFYINIVQLVLLVGLDLVLIPKLAAVGAALSMTIALITVNSLVVFLVLTYKEENIQQ